MARPKKNAAAAPAAPAQVPVAAAPAPIPAMPQPAPLPILQALPDNNAATLVINRAEYVRVRDSVYARLSTIQDLLRSFAADYVRQSNLLLGEPTSLDNVPSLHALASLDHAAFGFAPLAAEAVAPAAEEKKERKKRVHDPNAPKRPLTPYFLYMQTARPIIANDLGEEAPKGAVQEEGQRRWASMTPQEKMAWNNAYQFNLRLYNARVHSYKAGNALAREMSDQDALTYADGNAIPHPTVSGVEDAALPNDHDAIAEQLQLAAPVSAPASPEEAVKTPKPKATRKRKSTAAVEVEEGEASAVKTATPVASPEKKRKRQSKGAAEPVPEEPKKSGRKKKSA
ncbi:uncharacterized protein BCR38DRAFT_449911 [Pseudomassariella vexata]|uniref:HMG box domain-containing protein n=1 Tax=Pseudomassariella vexata TaxID=1141098 RepID=A0A1Y2DDL5_9PEZI|nr:uncharacterized protein BCR38DRAFT_449911 [Pseudomassariella vexata]ORY57206.1 hypothetical protein BCR38DRAFT_449911 [Pseudomassariella vexata]